MKIIKLSLSSELQQANELVSTLSGNGEVIIVAATGSDRKVSLTDPLPINIFRLEDGEWGLVPTIFIQPEPFIVDGQQIIVDNFHTSLSVNHEGDKFVISDRIGNIYFFSLNDKKHPSYFLWEHERVGNYKQFTDVSQGTGGIRLVIHNDKDFFMLTNVMEDDNEEPVIKQRPMTRDILGEWMTYTHYEQEEDTWIKDESNEACLKREREMKNPDSDVIWINNTTFKISSYGRELMVQSSRNLAIVRDEEGNERKFTLAFCDTGERPSIQLIVSDDLSMLALREDCAREYDSYHDLDHRLCQLISVKDQMVTYLSITDYSIVSQDYRTDIDISKDGNTILINYLSHSAFNDGAHEADIKAAVYVVNF